ncbi:MAG: metallophosphatase domain-containing protein [Blastocatellia bacterium]|nr:metallophosphatase domain-containing protein [Blastocatellia bacterium]
MRLVAISDTHSKHGQLEIPAGDVLIHAGDFTRIGSLDDIAEFNRWLGTLPHRHKIIIAGNHDWGFQLAPEPARMLITNAMYLQDSGATVAGVRFWGSPWQPWFMDWAFNLKYPAELREKWDLIPADTEVLITHGPPLGFGDRTMNGHAAGCGELLAAIRRIRPKVHICGHIHEGYGAVTHQGTAFINASSCDFHYQAINPPIVWDLEPPGKTD